MKSLKFIFMDAGQGDATLVVYPDNSLMLIDCGSTKSKGTVTPQIEQVLETYLPLTPGGNTITTLVLTHGDRDHYNLVAAIDEKFDIDFETVIFGGTEDEYPTKVQDILDVTDYDDNICNKDAAYDRASKPNAHLTRSDVKGWVLTANFPTADDDNKNSKSVVLLLEYQGVKIFLMGDAERATEAAIIKNYAKSAPNFLKPPSDGRVALKVGHHGSSRSSSPEWIKQIKPQVIFISCDKHSYHTPKKGLLDNIKKNTSLYAGDSHGYVYYDESSNPQEFKLMNTKEGIYTTLYQLTPSVTGGSYHYTINENGSIEIKRTN